MLFQNSENIYQALGLSVAEGSSILAYTRSLDPYKFYERGRPFALASPQLKVYKVFATSCLLSSQEKVKEMFHKIPR